MQRDQSLAGQVVVITGASSGIGRVTAIEFARRGAEVVLTARSAEGLEQTANECRVFGRRVVVSPGDVTDEEHLHTLARQTAEKFGHIDVWVNNAGVTALGTFEHIPDEVFRRIIETNFFGTVNGVRAVLPYFRQQDRGVIINMGSELSKFTMPYATAYTCSKFAVRALSDSLRQELLGTNIRVCTVMPASIDTPLFQHAGNYSGRAIKPARPVYSPQQAAEAIVDLAINPQREVFVGSVAVQMTALKRVAPNAQERLVAKMVDEDHFENRPASDSQGNLFQPHEPFAVSGGWQRRERMRTAREQGLNVLAVAPLAASLWYIWSQRRPEGEGDVREQRGVAS
jgi:short-subunit dehydrogenase